MISEQTKLTALVVDDDGLVREFLADYLSDLGLITESVATTMEGLDLVARKTYDVVFTDLNQTPSGVEVYRAATERKMVAYIITGGAPPAVMLEAQRVAGQNLIDKPVRINAIESIVERLKTEKSQL